MFLILMEFFLLLLPFPERKIAYHYLTENMEKLNKSGIKGVVVLVPMEKMYFFSRGENQCSFNCN